MSMKKFNWIRPYTIGKLAISFVLFCLVCNSYYTKCYFHFRSQNLLPDFISVTVPDKNDPDNSRSVIVEIINIPIVKPFIGGYVNKKTGEEWC